MRGVLLLPLLFLLVACSQAPIPDDRLLLFKEGTAYSCKNYDNFKSYVNNYWNSVGVINDGCEMTPGSEMVFAFKQHDQSFRNHTGEVEITARVYAPEDGAEVAIFYEDRRGIWLGSARKTMLRGAHYITGYGNGTEIRKVKLSLLAESDSNLVVDFVTVVRGN